jgi:hypothetical protein
MQRAVRGAVVARWRRLGYHYGFAKTLNGRMNSSPFFLLEPPQGTGKECGSRLA